jgi:hypothetical protein
MVHDSHGTVRDAQPNQVVLGHGRLSRFDDNHEKHITGTTQAQGHHMLPNKKTRYMLPLTES